MARDRLLYDFKGQVSAPGLLARAEASCITTKNMVFDAPGVARKRRGWRRITGALLGAIPWKVFSSSVWGMNHVVHAGPVVAAGAGGILQFYTYVAGVATAINAIAFRDAGTMRATSTSESWARSR